MMWAQEKAYCTTLLLPTLLQLMQLNETPGHTESQQNNCTTATLEHQNLWTRTGTTTYGQVYLTA